MVAFSDRPERSVKLSGEAALAVDLANAYLHGHLPGSGGWLEQDSYYVRLIDIALNIRHRRQGLAERKRRDQMERSRLTRRGRRR